MKTIDIKNLVKGQIVQVWNANREAYMTVTVARKGFKKAIGHYIVWNNNEDWTSGSYDQDHAKKHPVLEG